MNDAQPCIELQLGPKSVNLRWSNLNFATPQTPMVFRLPGQPGPLAELLCRRPHFLLRGADEWGNTVFSYSMQQADTMLRLDDDGYWVFALSPLPFTILAPGVAAMCR